MPNYKTKVSQTIKQKYAKLPNEIKPNSKTISRHTLK